MNYYIPNRNTNENLSSNSDSNLKLNSEYSSYFIDNVETVKTGNETILKTITSSFSSCQDGNIESQERIVRLYAPGQRPSYEDLRNLPESFIPSVSILRGPSR